MNLKKKNKNAGFSVILKSVVFLKSVSAQGELQTVVPVHILPASGLSAVHKLNTLVE